MALADLMELSLSKNSKKVGLSEERIKEQIPILRNYIAFWREYPDIFVEFYAEIIQKIFNYIFISVFFYVLL